MLIRQQHFTNQNNLSTGHEGDRRVKYGKNGKRQAR